MLPGPPEGRGGDVKEKSAPGHRDRVQRHGENDPGAFQGLKYIRSH